jgi:hypothetical protein
VKVFKALLTIDSSLLDFLRQIETHFSITIDNTIVEKIFKDAAEDQVTEKNYLIFLSKKIFLKPPMIIEATVDEYEPESIWITIRNLRDKDVNHFKNLIDG